MYMHHWGAGQEWMINMPLWVAPFISLVIIAAFWSLAWKGVALWHSARRGQPWWFVAMLLINTLGILEIIYLFFVAKLHFHELFTKGTSHPHSHPHHEDEHTHSH